MIFFAGCSFSNDDVNEITIEPYQLNEEEQKLVSITGVNMNFFKLNGSLKENEDLNLYIQEYKNGEPSNFKMLTELRTENTSFDNETISIGYNSFSLEGNESLYNWIIGSPSGSSSATSYVKNIKSSSFLTTISEKVNLKRNEPVIIGIWGGTKNGLIPTGLVSGNGELSEDFQKIDVAYVFMIELVEK